jgi:proteasome lid subunit RPN8/RPN11
MKLKSNAQDLLARALLDARGGELCALLLEDCQRQQEVVRVRNWDRESDSFFVARSEVQRVERYAERKGCKIIAFIHSHRSGLELSDTDRKSLAHSKYPWMVICLGKSGLEVKFYPNPSEPARSAKKTPSNSDVW